MTERPDKFPDWAMEDSIDPISLQNNSIEPPDEKKEYGWAYRDKGARNWFNFLGRYTGRWIRYLSEQRFESFTVSSLPDPEIAGEGSVIYVSDEVDGSVLAFSDGTYWRRVTDREIVS
jgi:hypothetical protein